MSPSNPRRNIGYSKTKINKKASHKRKLLTSCKLQSCNIFQREFHFSPSEKSTCSYFTLTTIPHIISPHVYLFINYHFLSILKTLILPYTPSWPVCWLLCLGTSRAGPVQLQGHVALTQLAGTCLKKKQNTNIFKSNFKIEQEWHEEKSRAVLFTPPYNLLFVHTYYEPCSMYSCCSSRPGACRTSAKGISTLPSSFSAGSVSTLTCDRNYIRIKFTEWVVQI